jgi:hypothetical protein
LNPPLGGAAGAVLAEFTLATEASEGGEGFPPPPQPAKPKALAKASAIQTRFRMNISSNIVVCLLACRRAGQKKNDRSL